MLTYPRHCVPKGGSENEPELFCEKVDRDYNVPYRIGSLFAILVTSGIGVFTPIVWRRISPSGTSAAAFLIVKQFGTGVMVATAFVHVSILDSRSSMTLMPNHLHSS